MRSEGLQFAIRILGNFFGKRKQSKLLLERSITRKDGEDRSVQFPRNA